MKDLTNEQLCGLAQAGDGQAISRLIEANLPFVRKVANQIVENPVQQEHLSACGVGFDDLVQAGSIGLWRAIDSYDFSRNTQFLTYAAPAVRRAMSDLIRQYSLDTVWRLRHDKANAWKIIYLDEDLDDTEDDTVETLIASPCAKLPEQIYIEQETAAELHEAMDALPDRENVYAQYRFGFTDGEDHPLTETAQYFHLTESRAKSVERSALKLLRQELLFEVPERAYARAEDKLTKELVAAGELHAVELRLKPQKKRGKKITAAVYEYLADFDGAWGELRYDFKGGTAEIILLAEWDTMVSHRFAMRAFEYLQKVPTTRLPEKFMLTFIGPEQFCSSDKLPLEQVIIDDWVAEMKIKLEQVIEAIETANEAFTYFYDTQTGETVYLQDEIITGERDEELEELIENSPTGRFLRFPTKYDIHEYSIMESFVESLPPGAARQELAHAIHGKGAFRRFKNGIYYHHIEQQWYDYQAAAYREIAIRWCRDEEIEYIETE